MHPGALRPVNTKEAMAAKLTRTVIAKEAGVSPSTVSRALSGSKLIPEETVARIREIAVRLGYQPNLLAKRLAFNRSFHLGFVLPLDLSKGHKGPLRMSYYSTILDGMVSVAYKRSYRVCLHPYEGESAGSSLGLIEIVKRRDADGLVLLGLTQGSPIPGELIEAKIPFVLIGSRHDGAFSINCDQAPAIRTMLSRITSLGYERLIHVKGASNYYDAIMQNKALAAAVKDGPFAKYDELEGDYSKTSGYEAAKSIFGAKGAKALKRKTCVFLACDRMAMGFYRYCQEKGIRIPDDVGVFGSDGDELSKVLHPELSTMLQPRSQMGAAAAKMLMDSCDSSEASQRELIMEEPFVEGASL